MAPKADRTGSISRIYLKDFLTFDEIEVKPKANLNLIIGPNGSGKSTLLCAICIGLGGKPVITGRGKELVDYVKHGKEKATVEIELRSGNSRPVVIRREFDRKNKSIWYIDKKEVIAKEVAQKTASLNIQVDNLCQFLPQDRVVNFSKMNRVQLLEATEKAVGDTSLYHQHELLRNSGHRLQDLRAKLKDTQGQLDLAVKKNAQLKDVVENHKLKNKMDNDIKELEKQQLWFLYSEKRTQHQRCKQERDGIRNVLESKRQEIQPARTHLEKNKAAVLNVKKKIHEKNGELKRLDGKVNSILSQCQQLDENIQDARREYESKKQEEMQREQQLNDFRLQLDVLCGQLRNMPAVDDAAAKQAIMDLTGKIQDASHKQADLQSKIEESIMVRRAAERKLSNLYRELAAIEDVTNRRMELLKEKNAHAYKASQWLKNNEDKFSAPIYHPMCTQLNIRDPFYAKFVEDRISKQDLVAFICENKDDMNKFKELMDKQKIRVNIVHSTASDLSQYQARIPIENLRQYGFQMYMIDQIEAPLAVLSFLCRNYGIFRIPIGVEGDYDSVPGDLTHFYMGESRYSKTRSRYDGEWSTSIFPVRPAQLLCITQNTMQCERLRNEIQTNQNTINEMEQKLKSCKAEDVEISKNLESWRNEKRVLQNRKDQLKQLQHRISLKESQIERQKRVSYNLPVEEVKMKRKIEEITTAMVSAISKSTDSFVAIEESTSMCSKLFGEQSVGRKAVDLQERHLSTAQQELADLEDRINTKNRELAQQKEEAQSALQTLQNRLGIKHHSEITPQIREQFQGSSLQATNEKLAELEARRDCLNVANDGEIQEYRQREIKVRELRQKQEEGQAAVEAHQQEMEESTTRWLPRIRELTENISARFSNFMARLGCSGEVLLDNGEQEDDFSKYGLMIKVRFHDGDKLRELTSQHQSGGERAVSTALYLLSLQSLTTVPFRCVDEINQGMDPINERRMLDMMMETAAADGASQYFFVTPKMLPDVEYNNHVNVMIVYNSPAMLSQRKLYLKKILQRRREQEMRN